MGKAVAVGGRDVIRDLAADVVDYLTAPHRIQVVDEDALNEHASHQPFLTRAGRQVVHQIRVCADRDPLGPLVGV